ncbi:MAG TPA: nuclear transport factor 2 family protein, partial [Bryobacteraceae bacterium]|nr:nuclear transport factor 2 family protein [Bryobacteraceae bacterium]
RRHWNTNLVITPTAEGASGTVYLFLMDVSAKPPAIQTAARYEDQLVKTADGWRFKHRQTKGDSAPAPAAAPKQ